VEALRSNNHLQNIDERSIRQRTFPSIRILETR
jgi:hypothetical protein